MGGIALSAPSPDSDGARQGRQWLAHRSVLVLTFVAIFGVTLGWALALFPSDQIISNPPNYTAFIASIYQINRLTILVSPGISKHKHVIGITAFASANKNIMNAYVAALTI